LPSRGSRAFAQRPVGEVPKLRIHPYMIPLELTAGGVDMPTEPGTERSPPGSRKCGCPSGNRTLMRVAKCTGRAGPNVRS